MLKRELQTQFRKEQIQRLEKLIPPSVMAEPLAMSQPLATAEPMAMSQPLPGSSILVPNHMKHFKPLGAKPIQLCMFQMVHNDARPFLLYLLNISQGAGGATFPDGRRSTLKASVKYMRELFPAADISYVGYYSTAERHVLILQYMANEAEAEAVPEFIWTTPHEIMNLQRILTYPIAPYIIDFFKQNTDLLVLRPADSWLDYETPVIGYYRTDAQLADIRPDLETRLYYFSEAPLEPSLRMDKIILVRSVIFRTDMIRREGEIWYAISDYNQHYPLSVHLDA